MNSVAENNYYELKVDSSKNRAYLTIKGFWKLKDIPNYLEDWKKALQLLKSDFTLLTDAREMAIHPAEVREVHQKAQNLIISAGVKKVAELQKAKIAEMQLDGLSKDSKMPKQNFNTEQEAIEWLDQ